jgi:hypothetical protein
MKKKLWGEGKCKGLPENFDEFVNTICKMGESAIPPYDKLVELMI